MGNFRIFFFFHIILLDSFLPVPMFPPAVVRTRVAEGSILGRGTMLSSNSRTTSDASHRATTVPVAGEVLGHPVELENWSRGPALEIQTPYFCAQLSFFIGPYSDPVFSALPGPPKKTDPEYRPGG